MSTQTIHKLSLRAGTADTSIDEKFKKDLHLFPTYAQGVAREPDYAFDAWLPRPDPSLHYEPLTDFEHVDPGTRVPDPLTNPLDELLKNAQTAEITPAIGTEVSGVQLSTLSPAQKDQLSVLAARRGVLIFREQDFQELSVPDALDWARYFGRLHIHPTSAHPEGYPEVHLVYRDRKSSFNYEKSDRTNSVTWHSDVSYETQPPGLTSLFLFSSPESGGDTLFVNTAKAYERLSPEFRERLHGLQVVHSGHEQANYLRRDGKRGGIVRREPVENVHPLVRTHPVTGQRAIYVQPQFTRRIVGYKREESDALLNFLYDHLAKSHDIQTRIRWGG